MENEDDLESLEIKLKKLEEESEERRRKEAAGECAGPGRNALAMAPTDELPFRMRRPSRTSRGGKGERKVRHFGQEGVPFPSLEQERTVGLWLQRGSQERRRSYDDQR